jgi:hypothetical protein
LECDLAIDFVQIWLGGIRVERVEMFLGVKDYLVRLRREM